MLYFFLIKWVLQLKKIEQNCPDDVNKINPACTTREENEESEDEENNIDEVVFLGHLMTPLLFLPRY